jgi:AraC-like DNA-binding protein
MPPENMPEDVVTACESEADAIRRSIKFAKRKFGYRQIDIAKLCGLESDNHLSAYKKARDGSMPEKHYDRFCQVTGCNLLAQYQARRDVIAGITGKQTQNDKDRALVERMLQVAA